MESSARRRAENETRFRTANEQIEAKAVELGIEDPVPFLCECSDATCREILLLSVEEFQDVRAEEAQFVLAPGHDKGAEVVVERRAGAEIAQKHGAEAQALEEGHARGDDG